MNRSNRQEDILQATYHGEVGVHGVEFHVDLFVDTLLGLGVVVLPHLTHFSAIAGHCSRVVNVVDESLTLTKKVGRERFFGVV